LTITEILSDETLRNREFPITRDRVFLGHAGVCPLPRRVAEAVRSYATQCTLGDQEELFPDAQIQECRTLAARLLKAQPEEIALVGPTSLALSFVAGGLTFRKNRNILVYHDDYPSNVYPWMALAEQGVEVRYLNTRDLGVIRDVDVIGQIDENTSLVALASCHFISGFRIDVDAIGKALHQRGILFCVDAIQTVGAFPTTVEHVDFLAADSHKWLLGPSAAGILYVRKSVQDQLAPMAMGWHNVRCPNFVAGEDIVFRRDARRYEAGSHNLLGLAGLQASLDLVLEVGVNNIAAELLRKRRFLVSALSGKGYEVVQAEVPDGNASGIVSFRRGDADLTDLHQTLARAHITTSLRMDGAGRRYIRLSPHYYNTDAELERLIEAL
jgi:cysteine desulfurase / selenocysteine lyase